MADRARDEFGRFARQIGAWQQKLDRTGSVALEACAREIAIEMVNLTKERFVKQRDPYGSVWKPKKKPDGRGALHGPTGRLKGGWFIQEASVRKILVRPSVRYAIYHQSSEPRRRIPRRMMIPDSRLGLPDEYEAAFEDVIDDVLSSYFRGDSISKTRSSLGIVRRAR